MSPSTNPGVQIGTSRRRITSGWVALVTIAVMGCGGGGAGGKVVVHPDRGVYEDKSMEELVVMCDGGDAGACTARGLALLEDAIPGDMEKIRHVFQKGCDGGDMVSCNELGVMMTTGDGGPVDAKKARELFVRSCDSGDCQGCLYLAEVTEADAALRADVLARSCDLGCSLGCQKLAYMWYEGETEPPGDGAEAIYDMVCDISTQHPFCPDVDDTTSLQQCKDECELAQQECYYLATNALASCELACDDHEVQSAYEKCLGSCDYKHRLAEDACQAGIDDCEEKCEMSCTSYGCEN